MKRFVLLLVVLSSAATAEVDFALPALDGATHRLSDYRGQWVVVNFWATWCKPCRKEIPDLSHLHEARDDITVLGLAFEDIEVEAFREFLESYPASYPILEVDVYDPPADLGAPRVLPTTHLIDTGGALVETWLGPVTSDMITEWIDEQP
jgi:thiol-disulfide isomerase/thioredoxin